MQEKVYKKQISVQKVWTKDNPADMLTKHLARAGIDKLLGVSGVAREDGRAGSAPQVSVEVELLPSS